MASTIAFGRMEPWSAETAYEALVDPGLSQVIGVYQLRASYVLVDLPAIREELLAAAHAHLRLGLLLMRAASRRAGRGGWEVLIRWARLIGEVAQLPDGQARLDALFATRARCSARPPGRCTMRSRQGRPPKGGW